MTRSTCLPKAFLQPSLSVYYDVNLGTGLYACLKVRQSLQLREALALNLNAGLGFNNRQWIETSGLSDLTIGASLTIKVGAMAIVPLINYTFVFLKEVNPLNEFCFGLLLIYKRGGKAPAASTPPSVARKRICGSRDELSRRK